MLQSVKQSFLFFLLLLVLNLVANLAMQGLALRKDFADFANSWTACIVLPVLYWITCQIQHGKFRYWLAPLFRTALWTMIVVTGFIADNRMNSEDLLYANNEVFLWWELFKLTTSGLRELSVILELVFEDILSIALVEFLIICIINKAFPFRRPKVVAQN
jgi:hypothetical protein